MNAQTNRDVLIDWISTQSDAPPRVIQPSTPLIEDGWLTSLQILDLLLFLEELRGGPVEPSALKPGAFRDVDTIAKRFLEDAQ